MIATAPGKVLLAGEYAVLAGAPAVVIAVNRRANAQVNDEPQDLSPFLAAVCHEIADRYGSGSPQAQRAACIQASSLELMQEGKKLGLGSSAAVTVSAVAAALAMPITFENRSLIHAIAHAAHAAAQAPRGARGSGADVAASVHGGTLEVQRTGAESQPLSFRKLPWPSDLELVLLWTGTPASTPELVARVRELHDLDPARHRCLQDDIAAASRALSAALLILDTKRAIMAMQAGGEALARLGSAAQVELVPRFIPRVDALARSLGGAVKPTGAGGGDLLAALFPSGNSAATFATRLRSQGMVVVDAKIDWEGVRLAHASPCA